MIWRPVEGWRRSSRTPTCAVYLKRSAGARIRSFASQDDGRCAAEANDGMGGEGRADAAPAQAKDPKRSENESYSEQRHSRQAECEVHAVHDPPFPMFCF